MASIWRRFKSSGRVAPSLDALARLFPGEVGGGVALMGCALAAIVIANSGWESDYFEVLEWVPNSQLGLSVLELINDVAMVIFFLVVGLELKRELMVGELRTPRHAVLPAAAALGGMLVPALIYAAVNAGSGGARGWGIPMATDVAFSLGVLALLGSRVPRSVALFLTALAIVDDLGAVAVIALFYSGGVRIGSLAAVAGLLTLLFLFAHRIGTGLAVFLLSAPVLWWLVRTAGIHPSIAGVFLAATVPIGREHRLERLEGTLRPWVTWLVLPAFALANAGVNLEDGGHTLSQPIALGVGLGLVAGKPIGILMGVWLAVRFVRAEMPMRWAHVAGAGALAGIGFTVSLFVAGLAFPDQQRLNQAKLGVLAASLAAGTIGVLILERTNPRLPPAG